jgi:hypothetical protein
MFHLELTDEEKTNLTKIVQDYLSELRMEIVDTDLSDYKDSLKHQRSVVNGILEKLTKP